MRSKDRSRLDLHLECSPKMGPDGARRFAPHSAPPISDNSSVGFPAPSEAPSAEDCPNQPLWGSRQCSPSKRATPPLPTPPPVDEWAWGQTLRGGRVLGVGFAGVRNFLEMHLDGVVWGNCLGEFWVLTRSQVSLGSCNLREVAPTGEVVTPERHRLT